MSGSNGRVLTLHVNGKDYPITGVEDQMTLADVLRDKLGLMGTKVACDDGSCGSCTVLVDGVPTLSCMTLTVTMEGKNIQTIEGLMKDATLDPIQEAFIEKRGTACGYCTPGFVLTTKALLEENPDPTVEEIKQALSGNICRCGVYEHIVESVQTAAQKLREED